VNKAFASAVVGPTGAAGRQNRRDTLIDPDPRQLHHYRHVRPDVTARIC
jgi:hypothetical protein